MDDDPQSAVYAAISILTRSERTTITPGLRIKEDLGIDSLEFVELVQLIEQKLGILIGDDVVASVRDVGALVLAVERSLGEERQAEQ
jgi:acyl carrier protein